MINIQILFFAFLISFLFSLLIILTKNYHGKLTNDTFDGVQKIHNVPTPRIGGVGIFFCFIIFNTLFFNNDLLTKIIFSSLPIFISGLIEDINKNVKPNIRLFFAFLSGLLFILSSGYKVESIDFLPIDALLSISLVSFIFTVFCIGGLVNSINIIDGFNGLASGSLILMLIAFSYISWSLGDYEILNICLTCTVIIFGFFIFNFPYGKIFLGDGGAYFCGFIIVSIAIMLPVRNPEISPWLCLLICSYPILETIISIIRKTKRRGHRPSMPDKLHLHMLVYRDLARRISNKLDLLHLRNSITSIIILILPASNCLLAILFYNNKIAIIFSLIFSYLAYNYLYKKCSFR